MEGKQLSLRTSNEYLDKLKGKRKDQHEMRDSKAKLEQRFHTHGSSETQVSKSKHSMRGQNESDNKNNIC